MESSGRRQPDSDVVESEQRCRAMVSASGHVLICLDPEHRVLEWNVAAEKLYGVAREDVLGRDYLELFIPSEHRAGVAADMAEVLEGRKTEGYVNPVRRSDGTERIVSWTATRLLDDGGNATGVIAQGIDITERLRVEAEARKAQQFSAALINSSIDGILAFDEDCHYTVWNPAMERISGVSCEACIGRCAFDVFPFLKKNGEDQYFYDALAGKHVVAKDRPFIVPETGREGFFEGYYSPLYDDDGQIQGGLAIIRDVTHRRNTEEQLQHQQADLIHASRLTMMGEMAAGLAHELNQPLFAIANFAQACINIINHPLPDMNDLMDLCQRSSVEAHRAGQIINRLREFVRKRKPSKSCVSINDLLQEVQQLIDFEARRYSIRIDCDLEKELPELFCDPIQIQQVLLNLIRNGIEAMLEQPVAARRLVIQSHMLSEQTLEVVVRDEGKGLPEGATERIFEMFYSTKKEGMGMGLAISRSIVEAHGGRLLASNVAAGGAEFRMTLPFQEPDDYVV